MFQVAIRIQALRRYTSVANPLLGDGNRWFGFAKGIKAAEWIAGSGRQRRQEMA
jgi:hypothetical protein